MSDHAPTTPSDATALSRRRLLRASAIAGLGGLVLAACGTDATSDTTSDTGDTPAPTPSSSQSELTLEQEALVAISAAGYADAIQDRTVIVATFEVNTGPGRRLQFGMLDESQQPMMDQQVEVAVVRSADREVVQTVTNPIFYGEGLGIRGVYVFETDLPADGLHFLVVAQDGHVGAAPMIVRTPENSQVIQTGQAFPAIASPTMDDPKGLAEVCTRTPVCSMHDASLDDLIAAGTPTVLVVATPKYCQTAICSPVVDVVEELKLSGEVEGVQFLHAEVFVDAGNTPTDLVSELRLPSEPWTFLIGADGTLADRFDGPVVPELLREAVQKLV